MDVDLLGEAFRRDLDRERRLAAREPHPRQPLPSSSVRSQAAGGDLGSGPEEFLEGAALVESLGESDL